MGLQAFMCHAYGRFASYVKDLLMPTIYNLTLLPVGIRIKPDLFLSSHWSIIVFFFFRESFIVEVYNSREFDFVF